MEFLNIIFILNLALVYSNTLSVSVVAVIDKYYPFYANHTRDYLSFAINLRLN